MISAPAEGRSGRWLCYDKVIELGNEMSTGGFPFSSYTDRWTLLAYTRAPTQISRPTFLMGFSICM